MNKNCTILILDSIHSIRSIIATTDIVLQNFKCEIQNSFVTWFQIRYWWFVDGVLWNRLKCNTKCSGDFLVA